jgi:hypothetical protein
MDSVRCHNPEIHKLKCRIYGTWRLIIVVTKATSFELVWNVGFEVLTEVSIKGTLF